MGDYYTRVVVDVGDDDANDSCRFFCCFCWNDPEETRRKCLERVETLKTITRNNQTTMKTTMKVYLTKEREKV